MSLVPSSTSPGVPEPFCIISMSNNTQEENPNKLFLGGIPSHATEKQLEDFFSQFGTVKDVRIVTDRLTAECKGYGFVTFDDKEDIQHLVDRKTIRMSGKKIRIRKAIRRNSSQFDHIRPVRSRSDTLDNVVVVSPGESSSGASLPVVIPRQHSSFVSTETQMESYSDGYMPLCPSVGEYPEVFYDVARSSGMSPPGMMGYGGHPMGDMGGMMGPHHQSGGVMMSPSPMFAPPMIHYTPRMSFSNSNPNWFRY